MCLYNWIQRFAKYPIDKIRVSVFIALGIRGGLIQSSRIIKSIISINGEEEWNSAKPKITTWKLWECLPFIVYFANERILKSYPYDLSF